MKIKTGLAALGTTVPQFSKIPMKTGPETKAPALSRKDRTFFGGEQKNKQKKKGRKKEKAGGGFISNRAMIRMR